MVPKGAAAFPIGVKVEVCNNTAGFKGSWHEATIVRAIRRRRSYDVEYVSRIANDDPTQPPRKTVLGSLVRPWRPGKVSITRYAVRKHVDAYHNGGWRCGVVSASHGDDPPGRYNVRFTVGNKEEMEFSPAEIRPHLEWRHGHWCPLKNQFTFSVIVKQILSLEPDDPMAIEILTSFTFTKGLTSQPRPMPKR